MSNFINKILMLRRGPWEMVASVLIALGVVMLMQPLRSRYTPIPLSPR